MNHLSVPYVPQVLPIFIVEPATVINLLVLFIILRLISIRSHSMLKSSISCPIVTSDFISSSNLMNHCRFPKYYKCYLYFIVVPGTVINLLILFIVLRLISSDQSTYVKVFDK